MRELEDDLNEIKREIVESRNLVIKSNNIAAGLATDLKSIARKQSGYEKKISWNSATAYVVFVVVVFVSLKIAVDARVHAIEATYTHLGAQNKELIAERDTLRAKVQAYAAAELEAARFYDLVRQNRRVDVVRAYEAIKTKPLTKTEQSIFADAVERARGEQASILYFQALDAMKLQRWQEASNLLEESTRYKDDSAISPYVKLQHGIALRKLKKNKEAVLLLAQVAEQNIDKEVVDDALYQLASCQEDMESWNEAKNSWRTLLKKFPDSPYGNEAKLKLAALMRLH